MAKKKDELEYNEVVYYNYFHRSYNHMLLLAERFLVHTKKAHFCMQG